MELRAAARRYRELVRAWEDRSTRLRDEGVGRVPSYGAGSAARRRPLLAPAFRPAAAALAVVFAGFIALLGVLFAHQGRPGRLDTAVDNWIRSGLGGHQRALPVLASLGGPVPVTVMTSVLALACIATRRVRVTLLAAVAVPAAAAVTEFVVKPVVGRTIFSTLSFPSGHVTGLSALVTILAVLLIGPLHPPLAKALRVLLACAGAVLVIAVAAALVALGRHYFTDTVAGAAVGASVVLVTALILDRLIDRPRAQADDHLSESGDHQEITGFAES
jgi:membrane-associated phospholipid phosphatase